LNKGSGSSLMVVLSLPATSAVEGAAVMTRRESQPRLLTHMYGPAVRRKRFHRPVGLRSCINVSGL
jgi:hypothetical protein